MQICLYSQSFFEFFYSSGIRVNSINPGFVDTDFHTTEGITRDTDEYANLCEMSGSVHPLGRIGTVDDCVHAISFFANEKSSFLTGALLLVDGGLGTKGAW